MLLESSGIDFEDEAEHVASPCADLFLERANIAREIIWLVVQAEAMVDSREKRQINMELERALRQQAAIKALILRSGCLLNPDEPF
jgi:hypothetical protein